MRLLLLSVALLLSACATPPQTITNKSIENAQKLQQHNQTLNTWRLRAQVSLNESEQHYSFNALWHQQQDQYLLQFDTLLFSSFMQLQGKNGFAELRLEDKIYTGNNPEQLIAQLTPFKIPVTGLSYWIRGLKQPGLEAQQDINADGSIHSIKQQGWRIEYLDWDHFNIHNSQYWLPSDIVLKRKEIEIRIQPSSWSQKRNTPINPIFTDLE